MKGLANLGMCCEAEVIIAAEVQQRCIADPNARALRERVGLETAPETSFFQRAQFPLETCLPHVAASGARGVGRMQAEFAEEPLVGFGQRIPGRKQLLAVKN